MRSGQFQYFGSSCHAMHVLHASSRLLPCVASMALRSRYTRPPDGLEASSSTLDVALQSKRKAVRPSPTKGTQSSSTPDDTERTSKRTRSPKSTTIEAIIDMYGERPLPPVPRIPSSIYASSKRTTAFSNGSPVSPESPRPVASPPSPATPSPISPVQGARSVPEKDLKSARHLSQLFRKEKKRRSSTNDAPINRRDLVQGVGHASIPEAKVKAVKAIPFTEWKAPVYQEPCISPNSSPRTPLSQRSASFDSPKSSAFIGKTAEGRAASYFAVIDPAKSTSLGEGYSSSLSTLTKSPSLPLSKMKSTAKQPIELYPLQTSSLPENPPQSHFSPSSPNASDIDSSTGITSSLRTRAKKVLLQSRIPKRPGLKHRMDSSQSDLSCTSPVTTPPPSIHTSAPLRNSMQQGLSDMYETLQNMYPQSRQASAKPILSRANQSSPFKRNLVTTEARSPATSLLELPKYGRKAGEEAKKQPYVYRVPRKRLSKPQMPTVLMTTNTKSPDMTYKIEMPAPPTPNRPKSGLLFDHTYYIDMASPTVFFFFMIWRTMRSTSTTTRSHHLSRSFSGSASSYRHSNRHFTAEKQRMHRHSLPTATHTRQNTDDTTPSKVASQVTDSSTTSKKEVTSLGMKFATSIPMLGLARRETESVSFPNVERERNKVRTGSSIRPTSAEMRRQHLKNTIVVMGNPSAVGVPF